MTGISVLFKRELILAWRQGGALGTALGFYLIIVAFMPLGLGPDTKLLSRIAPGVLWIGLLLAALLSLPRIFEADQEDGSLDLLAMGSMPMEVVCGVKGFAHWLSIAVPLCLAAPVLGLLMNLDIAAYPALLVALLVGSPAVSFLGAIGGALTIGTRRGGLLLALLVLPLYVPTLIFGISAISAVVTPPGSFEGSISILAAISLASIVLGPFASAAAIRVQLG